MHKNDQITDTKSLTF